VIRLETSKKTGIDNHQDRQLSAFDVNWGRDLPKIHKQAIQRTGISPSYNCHGLTFASRRTHIIDWSELQKILRDDDYKEIELRDVLAGDIVIYLRDGDANHSGVVVEYTHNATVLPMVCSKWGCAGEFIHSLMDRPSVYGPDYKFFRCRL
jgi:hypothetical protein